MTRKPRGHTKGRTGRPYRRQRAIFKAHHKKLNSPCSICHGKYGPINYNAPNDREDWAFQPDHIIPWSKLAPNDRRRWDSSNWAPAHARCNRRKQAKLDYRVKQPPARPAGW